MGTCKKCGECCKWVYWCLPEPRELTTLEKFRGFTFLTDTIVGIPCACSRLDKETGLCKDYDNRPEECKVYPEGGIKPKECKYEEDEK